MDGLLAIVMAAEIAAANASSDSIRSQFPLECVVVSHGKVTPNGVTTIEPGARFLIEEVTPGFYDAYSEDETIEDWKLPYLGSFKLEGDGKSYLAAEISRSLAHFSIAKDWERLFGKSKDQIYFSATQKLRTYSAAAFGLCDPVNLKVSKYPFKNSLWPAPKYAEVRGFYYTNKSSVDKFYDKGIFADSIVNKGGMLLTPRQVEKLINATTGAHAEHARAGCFIPRHAFAFFDESGKLLSYAEICFECLNYQLSNMQGDNFDLLSLAELVEEIGLPLGPHIKNSEDFRQRFNAINRLPATSPQD